MKFNLRILLAAAALASMSGQATASISNTNAILYVWNSGNSSSYIQDIGPVSSFSHSNSATQTFAVGGASWNSFINQANFSSDLAAGRVNWGVTGSASASSFFSTVSKGQVATLPNDTAIGNVNSVLQSVTNGSSSPTDFAAANSTGMNNWNLHGSQLNQHAGFSTGNAVGETGVSLAQFSAGADGVEGAISPFIQTASFTMGGATLTMAAVPEPESYAFMLIGLMMVGGMLRYRKGSAD